MKYVCSSNQYGVCLHNFFPLQQTMLDDWLTGWLAGWLAFWLGWLLCIDMCALLFISKCLCTDFYLHKFFEKTMHLSISFIICTSNTEFNMKLKLQSLLTPLWIVIQFRSLHGKLYPHNRKIYLFYFFVWCQLLNMKPKYSLILNLNAMQRVIYMPLILNKSVNYIWMEWNVQTEAETRWIAFNEIP